MIKRQLCCLLLVFAVTMPANAGTQSYLKWFETASSQIRIAASYLRTGNNDFAALALEKLIEIKSVIQGNKKLSDVVVQTVKVAKQALEKIDNGNPKAGRKILLGLRDEIYASNLKNNIVTFQDCIWVLVKTGPALWHFKKNPPEFSDQASVSANAKAAKDYLNQLNKCDGMAGAEIKADARYKRLVEGARSSLERLPLEALKAKDKGLLYRFIIELRSFDRLLYFRFG